MDNTAAFLPHRLNRQPVVVCGLTIDELRVCVGLCGAGSAFQQCAQAVRRAAGVGLRLRLLYLTATSPLTQQR